MYLSFLFFCMKLQQHNDITLTQMVVLGKNLVQGFLDQKETQNDGSIFFLNISMKLQQHKDCKFGEAI